MDFLSGSATKNTVQFRQDRAKLARRCMRCSENNQITVRISTFSKLKIRPQVLDARPGNSLRVRVVLKDLYRKPFVQPDVLYGLCNRLAIEQTSAIGRPSNISLQSANFIRPCPAYILLIFSRRIRDNAQPPLPASYRLYGNKTDT